MSQKKKDKDPLRRMADMLRQGAALTERACPACASPLFRLGGGGLWCAKCQKKVVIVREGEEPTKMRGSMVLDDLETTLLEKVQRIRDKMKDEEDMDELQKLSSTLSELLDNLEKIRRSKRV